MSVADLQSLITEGAMESAYLEFKRQLPGRDASGTNELVADISAFANSGGGDLLYGIGEDEQARALAIVPLVGNADEEVRRLQQLLVSNVEPTLPGVKIRAISVGDGYVIVVRVPQSWAGPHRVRTSRHFYLREGARKRPLEVPEIRSLFLRSGERAQRVRDFRTERLGKLLSGEGPQPLAPGVLVVVHLIPAQAMLGTVSVDPVPYTHSRYLPLIGAPSSRARLNLDGAIAIRSSVTHEVYGYSLLFRSGFFESVRYVASSSEGQSLPSRGYEEHLIKLLSQVRVEFAHLNLGSELACMLSLLRAKGLRLGVGGSRYIVDDEDEGVFDRDSILLPDVLLSGELDAADALKPVFDLMWQAAGFVGSDNYDEQGRRVSR